MKKDSEGKTLAIVKPIAKTTPVESVVNPPWWSWERVQRLFGAVPKVKQVIRMRGRSTPRDIEEFEE